ncbi:MAG: NusG domain II-containing protein [Bacillota bacterium]
MQGLRFKPLDFLIIGLLLAAGLAGFWFNLKQGDALPQKYVIVYVDNNPVAELSLAESDTYQYTFNFGEAGRHEAVLEIEGGRVRLLPMDHSLCPRGICAHTGWIEHSYESIVCLPNRIMVVFSHSSAGPDEMDGVTF